jgi:DTW domain-containing protein YfiP
MSEPFTTKTARRVTCLTCLRPQRTCICHWVTPTRHAVEVLILQHPLEVDNAKGSARLLHLSLPHSRLVTGEFFSESELHAYLDQPFEERIVEGLPPGPGGKQTILLYPDTPEDKALGIAPPPLLDHACLREPAQLRLVVLDGTWRKSRKMLYLNPLLQQLPRLPLRNAPASQYLIRKAHRPDQLSTLEATCYALMQLEADNEKYQPLFRAFDGFVAQQSGYRDRA